MHGNVEDDEHCNVPADEMHEQNSVAVNEKSFSNQTNYYIGNPTQMPGGDDDDIGLVFIHQVEQESVRGGAGETELLQPSSHGYVPDPTGLLEAVDPSLQTEHISAPQYFPCWVLDN